MSDSFLPLQSSRLLCPWDSPGRNTGAGCHFLLQGIFPTQGWNPRLLRLLHWHLDSLPLCCVGSPTLPAKRTNELIYKPAVEYRCEKQTYGYRGGGGINWEIGINLYTLLYIIKIIRTCCIAQETLLNI